MTMAIPKEPATLLHCSGGFVVAIQTPEDTSVMRSRRSGLQQKVEREHPLVHW